MVKIDKLGIAKKFGTRYGATPKHKYAKIEKEKKTKHKCPFCNYPNVRYVAVGIWKCGKCEAKFAAKAYGMAKSKEVQ